MPAHTVRCCTLEDGVHDIVVYYEDIATEYESISYLHICRGVSDDELIVSADSECETYFARKSDGTIREFVLADLKAS